MSNFCLPEDVLVLVLIRLPAKSVGRCKCVCRSLKALISSSEFIQFHLEYQSSIQTKLHGYLSSSLDEAPYLAEYSIKGGRDSENLEVGLEIQPLYNPDHHSHVAQGKILMLVGSCNGLICQILFVFGISRDCSIYGEYEISLCNPITKSIWLLPKSPSYLKDEIRRKRVVFYGFGYDDLHDTYKVFVANGPPHDDYVYDICSNVMSDAEYEYEMFCLTSNKWMTVSRDHDFNDYHIHASRWKLDGVLFNRALHWIIKKPERSDPNTDKSKRCYILAFDLIIDKLSILAPLPEATEDEYLFKTLELSVMNGCLLLINQSSCHNPEDIIDMWVMKEYGLKNSWTRICIHNSPYDLWGVSLVALLVEDNISYHMGKLIYHDTMPIMPICPEEHRLLTCDIQSNQVVELPPPQSELSFRTPKQLHFVASLVQPHPTHTLLCGLEASSTLLEDNG